MKILRLVYVRYKRDRILLKGLSLKNIKNILAIAVIFNMSSCFVAKNEKSKSVDSKVLNTLKYFLINLSERDFDKVSKSIEFPFIDHKITYLTLSSLKKDLQSKKNTLNPLARVISIRQITFDSLFKDFGAFKQYPQFLNNKIQVIIVLFDENVKKNRFYFLKKKGKKWLVLGVSS